MKRPNWYAFGYSVSALKCYAKKHLLSIEFETHSDCTILREQNEQYKHFTAITQQQQKVVSNGILCCVGLLLAIFLSSATHSLGMIICWKKYNAGNEF